MAIVGDLTIKTKIDNNDLDKQIKAMESSVKKAQKELEKLEEAQKNLSNQKIKIGIEIDKREGDIEKQLGSYYEIVRNKEKYNINTISNAERIIQEMHEEDTTLQELYSKYDEVHEQTKQNEKAQENFKEQIVLTNQKIEDTKNAINMKDKIEDMNKSLSKTVNHVIKWGLAMFGIRGAFSFIRSAMSTLSSYNEQIGVDIQYIRFALASSLKKVIEDIIQLVYKLLTYINYISYAWFKVNIFANATTDAFKKTNKAVQNTNSSAKQLQKTLAGFDEMNILQENGGVASGGGGGGITLPGTDLSDLQNIKIPGWIDWIAKNKNSIIDFFAQVSSIIAGIKIAQFLTGLSGISGVLSGMSNLQIFGMLGGISLTMLGIYETIQGLIKWIGDPTWQNFTSVLSGLETALIGVGIAMISLNASNPIGWIATAVGVVGKIIGAFSDWGKKTEETTIKLIGTKEATEELKQAQDELSNQTKRYTSAVKNAEEAQKTLEEAEKRNKISGEELFRAVQLGTIDYKNMTDAQKSMTDAQREVFEAYIDNLDAQKRLEEETQKYTTAKNDARNASITLSSAIYEEKGNFDEYFQALVTGFENGEISAGDFLRAVNGMLHNMDDETKLTFLNSMPKSVYDGLAKSKDLINQYPGIVIGLWSQIQKATKNTFMNEIPKEIANGLSEKNIMSSFFGFKNAWEKMLKGLNTNIVLTATAILSGSKHGAKGLMLGVPRLATGGIVSMPGRGVPIGNAIIGERGREAVLPLTDTQQMAMLGEAIGRYITINAQMNNYMNGRLISRELQKVQNEEDFAFNR